MTVVDSSYYYIHTSTTTSWSLGWGSLLPQFRFLFLGFETHRPPWLACRRASQGGLPCTILQVCPLLAQFKRRVACYLTFRCTCATYPTWLTYKTPRRAARFHPYQVGLHRAPIMTWPSVSDIHPSPAPARPSGTRRSRANTFVLRRLLKCFIMAGLAFMGVVLVSSSMLSVAGPFSRVRRYPWDHSCYLSVLLCRWHLAFTSDHSISSTSSQPSYSEMGISNLSDNQNLSNQFLIESGKTTRT